jgi:ferric-dicitrate binding protein FerR (iron transport regulator)
MDCAQVQELLNAFVDVELPFDENARIEAHLESCADCQHLQQALLNQDAGLREAVASSRLAAQAIAERVNSEIRNQSRNGAWPRLTSLLLAAAAGFLIAVGVFQPWRQRGVDTPIVQIDPPPGEPKNPLALVVAKEPVEILLPGTTTWQTRKAGEALQFGCPIRTKPDSRCEIQTSDSSEIRLNGGTELSFQSARQIQLTTGQIMARVARDLTPFQVAVAATTITALGTEFDIYCKPTETTLLVLEGSTSVAGKDSEQVVNTGEFAKIVGGKVSEKEQVDPMLMMLTTRWVNEILVLKGRDNPELTRKIDDILAQLGRLKGDFMGEQEIRSLGDRCVLPLTRYLQSPSCLDASQTNKRVMAARILSDLAQSWSIPDLIDLLGHSDSEVRVRAAKALERLTGVNQGEQTENWRRNPPARLEAARARWKDWWRRHQDQFHAER